MIYQYKYTHVKTPVKRRNTPQCKVAETFISIDNKSSLYFLLREFQKLNLLMMTVLAAVLYNKLQPSQLF